MRTNSLHLFATSKWRIRRTINFASSFLLFSFTAIEASQVQKSKIEKRELKINASFSSIRIEGNVSLVLTNKPAGTVIIEGKEKDIQQVNPVFENNVLVLDAGRKFSFAKLTIYLSALTLQTIQLNGDGNISSGDCIQADSLHMLLNGNIKVKIKTLGHISFDAPDDIEVRMASPATGMKVKTCPLNHEYAGGFYKSGINEMYALNSPCSAFRFLLPAFE